MCGPLVVAFPASAGGRLSHLLYHGGRVSTYTAVGALLGGSGGLIASAGGNPLIWAARLQVAFSVAAGVFLAVFGLSRLGLIREPRWMYTAAPSRLLSAAGVKPSPMPADGRPKAPASMLRVGLMMGLLPCGLSYAAFGRALPAGGAAEGALLVLAFGLGTVPALLAVGLGAGGLLQRFRAYSDPLSGMLMMGMAVRLLVNAATSAWAA
jgi:sulfite exporter TauE/SafE